MTIPRSPLAKMIAAPPARREELDGMRRRAWRELGMLLVEAGDGRLTVQEREIVRQIGDKLHGGSRGHGHKS